MYQYVLFDLDGTLTDSREGIVNSVRYSLEKLGKPCPDEKTLLHFIGPPLQESYMECCGMTEAEAWHAVEVFRERYESIGWAENKAAEGIVDLMRRMKERGCIMAIASSKPERSVIPISQKFGFTEYLDAACGSDGVNESKADVIRDALRRLKIAEKDQHRAVMVGDRKYDVEGAADCGLRCIGVEFFGFSPEGELESSNAVAVCKTVKELEMCLMNG